MKIVNEGNLIEDVEIKECKINEEGKIDLYPESTENICIKLVQLKASEVMRIIANYFELACSENRKKNSKK